MADINGNFILFSFWLTIIRQTWRICRESRPSFFFLSAFICCVFIANGEYWTPFICWKWGAWRGLATDLSNNLFNVVLRLRLRSAIDNRIENRSPDLYKKGNKETNWPPLLSFFLILSRLALSSIQKFYLLSVFLASTDIFLSNNRNHKC